MRRLRVAIVTPWYGEEATGGAESLARELASRLAAHDEVTVLTTTSRSFIAEWDVDYHKPGRARSGAITVRRFRVNPRNRELFQRLNEELSAIPKGRWAELGRRRAKTDLFIEESINSRELEHHLAHRARSLYDAVVFLPYLYGVVVRGIEAYPGRAHLIPCLHDEVYARIPRIEDALHRAGTLLFNSAGEAELALRLYGPGILAKSHLVGTGIPPAPATGTSPPIAGRYFLYLGRREPEKGVDFLVDLFRRRARDGARDPALVLAGPGERSYDEPSSAVFDLGFVDEATKIGLLRGAVALLNASTYESYSRVLMEAWREEIPVIAHAACLPTATAVRESGGGFIAETAAEWLATLREVERMDAQRRRELGRKGASYAAEHADWGKALARLRAVIGDDGDRSIRGSRRIDQVVEGFDAGDAISEQARFIQETLHRLGYRSAIYAALVPPGIRDAQPLQTKALGSADAIIYHHSIGSQAAQVAATARRRKALVYHNITPAHFFAPYAPAVAEQLEQGRRQLAEIAWDFDCVVAGSEYNAAELRELGLRGAIRVIPVVDDFRRLDVTPAERFLKRSDRGTTWLFVGRVAPNKGLRELVEAFEVFLALDDAAHLIVAGKYDRSDRYFRELQGLVFERRLDPYVTFTGFIDEPTLVSCYRGADVFVCLSEHEGFCVPLVEAMFFDVPIVAKATAAVPETLGAAGLILEPEADPYAVAAAVGELCKNADVRTRVLEAQRERRRAFLPARVRGLIEEFVTELLAVGRSGDAWERCSSA